MSYIDDSVAQTEVFEGNIPYMYQDSRGNVTAGVGIMLADAEAAQALPFQIDHIGGLMKATADEIASDYGRVKASHPGFLPAYYHWAGSLTLGADVIASLLRNVIVRNDTALAERFAQYDSWPAPAKLAVLDMAYNLGTAKLFSEYTHLMASLQGRYWKGCAGQCARDSSDPAFAKRNDWTRQQFLLAASA